MMTIVEILAEASVGLLGWAALRFTRQLDHLDTKVDDHKERLVRIEGAINNGLSSAVDTIKSELRDHMSNEEDRLVEVMKRRGY